MDMRVLETDSPDAGPDVDTAGAVGSTHLPRQEQSTWTWPVDRTEEEVGPPGESPHDSLAGTLLMAMAWANQNF